MEQAKLLREQAIKLLQEDKLKEAVETFEKAAELGDQESKDELIFYYSELDPDRNRNWDANKSGYYCWDSDGFYNPEKALEYKIEKHNNSEEYTPQGDISSEYVTFLELEILKLRNQNKNLNSQNENLKLELSLVPGFGDLYFESKEHFENFSEEKKE